MDILESQRERDFGRAGPGGVGPGRRWTTYAVIVAVAVGAGFLLGRDHGGATADRTAAPRSVAPLSESPTPPVAAQLRTHHYRLLTRGSDVRVTVDLVGTTRPAAEAIRVAVIGHVSNGEPGREYRLVGGRCPSAGTDVRKWAAGRTNSDGDAVLRGQPALLSKIAAYWLVVKPWPRNIYYFSSPPGLEGLWQTRSVFRFPAGEPGC
jgi:hypothetical protein